ncbi:DUF6984 family protein [Stenotrophomonas pavanii]|uniref:DUF6984 family protein n=1 Tax=Stenotrophomonas pavanii TaxID=487698 RepID=UPI000944DD3F|nr:hypothetical protein [Stenotrophomonas pavanii]
MRTVSSVERALIEAVAVRLHAASASQLQADLASAIAVEIGLGGARVGFVISGYERLPYQGQHAYPVELQMQDADGAELTPILHADASGRLLELEIIRWDGAELISPQIESVVCYA